MHHIVVETEVEHAPLIAAPGSTRRRSRRSPYCGAALATGRLAARHSGMPPPLGIAFCTVNTFWPPRGPKAIR